MGPVEKGWIRITCRIDEAIKIQENFRGCVQALKAEMGIYLPEAQFLQRQYITRYCRKNFRMLFLLNETTLDS